ncbi:AbrB/MazE/SpoVT family DNA-binding domain-containing protein [Deinococcus altitudinis]|uniref:AbrB/MazE/SpoVT family DNA-binding domain-containing protein n=1 Tax=Deinococcus altitudinis TaxID=468914 RepID=UPI003891A449
MKIHVATVSSKGQVVLPREIRDRLGIGRGDQIEFVSDDQGIHLRPKPQVPSALDAWLGAAPTGGTATADLGVSRHAGMSEHELELTRAGPGARITRLDLQTLGSEGT